MAATTVELRTLLERTDFRLFDFDYTFDDSKFKPVLEQAVLDFFYDYEIAFETPDMFKRRFIARWRRVMYYYNKLYNTTLLQYNPLINAKMSEALEQLSNSTTDTTSHSTASGTSDSTTDGTSESTTTGDTTNHQTTVTDSDTKASDYPQQAIAGGDFLSGEQVTSGTSETDGNGTSNSNTDSTSKTTTAASSSDESNSTGNTVGKSDMSYEKTIEGLTGSTYQALIAAERANILRITEMVINEMKPCFMMVY